jgi:methionyl-tRNA formyltransferase
VRAFNPVPVAETLLAGEQLRIFCARALDEYGSENAAKSADPGTIIRLHDDSMIVQCGRGWLAVTEVQRPGRRRIAVRELSHSFTLEGRRLG